MGVSRRAGRAVTLAAMLCAGARAGASVQVDPIARLSLEGGYDSNVLYNGRGGDNMGRVSPDLGFQLRDHTWNLTGMAGGDLLMYPQRDSSTVWNQRGRLLLRARPSERVDVTTDLDATYAFDPIGLARLGIFGQTGAALITNGAAKVGWSLEREWRISGLFEEHLVRFDNGTGAASHTPGIELTRKLDRRLEVGGVYKYDYFQGLGPGAQNAQAHEAQGLLRYRWARRTTLEARVGPALWSGPTGATSILPEASIEVLSGWRGGGGARVAFRHGVGLGLLATPGLFDSLEGGITTRVGSHFVFHADGGLWRSGAIPWGANAVLGYGVEGSFDYRVGPELLVGVGGSRFARLDVSIPEFDRNILGLHVTWELRHPRGGP